MPLFAPWAFDRYNPGGQNAKKNSVYWIPVYQILEARGFEVYLVNAHHVKNVPGKKRDVSDCQWMSISTLLVCCEAASGLLV